MRGEKIARRVRFSSGATSPDMAVMSSNLSAAVERFAALLDTELLPALKEAGR